MYNGKKIDDIGNKWFIGHPINVYYDYKKIGIWQLNEAAEAAKYGCTPGQIKLQDTDSDGKYTDADRVIIGTTQPKFVLNLTNTFTYQNWDFSFDFYTRWGNYTSCGFFSQPMSGKLNKLATLDYWTAKNPTNSYPQPNEKYQYYPTYSTSLTYRDASFIRLKQLSLGYNLPKSSSSLLHITNARFYLTGENFWYWTKAEFHKNNMEPEWSGDAGANPAARTIILGMNITF